MVGQYTNQQLHGSRAGLMSSQPTGHNPVGRMMLPLRDRFSHIMVRIFGGKPNA